MKFHIHGKLIIPRKIKVSIDLKLYEIIPALEIGPNIKDDKRSETPSPHKI